MTFKSKILILCDSYVEFKNGLRLFIDELMFDDDKVYFYRKGLYLASFSKLCLSQQDFDDLKNYKSA